jgi:hypothetical protein
MITLTLTSEGFNSQSFVIGNGDTLILQLRGFTMTVTGMSIVTVPVRIQARA